MNVSYIKLKDFFYQDSIISDIDNILQWDLSTMMPEHSRTQRARQLCFLNDVKHKMFSDPKVKDLFKKTNEKQLSFKDAKNFKEMKKKFNYFSALPSELIKKKTILSSECEGIWRKAKLQSKFSLVKKSLSDLIKIIREEAQILSDTFECSPYDALLRNYEDSYSSDEIEKIFKKLHPFINDIYEKIIKKQKKEEIFSILKNLSNDEQFTLSKYFMKKLGFNFKKGRIDQSCHPFCGGGIDDIRITTRLNKNDSFAAFEAVMHETGHALYEQGLPKEWQFQPVGKSGGMALHESQSLFIEMQIMKSSGFQKFLSKTIKDKFKYTDESWSSENLFKIFNKVQKSFIRVESDEVTYPLHIILRFKIEQKIIKNEINTADIPQIWNYEFKKLFGFEVDNDANGCLQDIHWYTGLFGYFPTYTLGALISAQLAASMRNEIEDLDSKISNGSFKDIVLWLKKNIHSKGRFFSTEEIINKVTNQKLSDSFFKKYLERKYL